MKPRRITPVSQVSDLMIPIASCKQSARDSDKDKN